jgi:hypothetical protein
VLEGVVCAGSGVVSTLGSGATRWTTVGALWVLMVTLGAVGSIVAVLVVVGLGVAVVVLVVGVAVSVETTCRTSVGRWSGCPLSASANAPPRAPAAASVRTLYAAVRPALTAHPRTARG